MKKFLLMLVVLGVLGACSTSKSSTKETQLTIEPKGISEQEQQMINATGADVTQFFTLNGTLNQDDDLETKLLYFENGKQSDGMKMYGKMENTFNDDLVSFSLNQEKEIAHLTIGQGNGLGGTNKEIPENITGSTWGGLSDKHTLNKGEPVYISYWYGTTADSINTSFFDDPTVIPDRLKEADFAIVMSIELIDRDDHQN